MSAVFTQADATVIGSLFALVATLTGLYVQNRRAHQQNHAEHAATFHLVRKVAADVKEVRADQRKQGSELRSHGDRLRRLELDAEPVKPSPIKAAPKPRKRSA